MGATENPMEVCIPSTEFEHQALMITVANDYKEPNSPQSSPSDFSQILFTLLKLKTFSD